MLRLTEGRKYFGDTREPFFITLAGEKLYVLTSPSDFTMAFRNSSIIRDLLAAFGVSEAGVERLYQTPTAEKPVFQPRGSISLPRDKSVGHLKGDFYHYQLYPGEKFNLIQERFLRLIDEAMRPENFNDYFVHSSTSSDIHLSLNRWCQHVLISAGTTAFFGKTLLQKYPGLLQHFVDFDDNN